MPGFGDALDYLSRHGQLDYLYWLFFGTLAIIILFVVSRLVRNLAGQRVRQIEEFGMDFDSVTRMLDRGLLTAEEAKQVKSVLASHFKTLYDKPKSRANGLSPRSAEQALAAELQKAGKPSETMPEPSGPTSAPAPEAAADFPSTPADAAPASVAARPEPRPEDVPAAPPPDEAEGEVPLDVLDMYRAGMISGDEFGALRRFYAARAKNQR